MAFVKSIPVSTQGVLAVLRKFPRQAVPLTELTIEIMRDGSCNFSVPQRELIAAFTSGVNGCEFCFNTHKETAAAFGIDPDLFESLFENLDNSPIEAALKPVLFYVRKLTLTPSKMLQADADAIFDAGWDETDFQFMIMICGLFNLYNRMMDGYGIKQSQQFYKAAGERLANGPSYAGVIDAL